MSDVARFIGAQLAFAAGVFIPLKYGLINTGVLGQQNALSTALLGAGAIAVANLVYQLTRMLLSIYVLPGKPIKSFGPPGSYAIITGASDGIGKQFAVQLASAGYNLILASRTHSKLESVRTEILSSHPSASIDLLAIDFSTATEQDYQRLSSLCENKHISILINNVGQSHDIPVLFAETSPTEINQIININVFATLRVTQTVLPFLRKNKNGLILTMGSMGGLTPVPLLATYSGSKAFLQQWSTSLAGELSREGITVHFLQAYLITSAMSKIRKSSWAVPSEKQFVKAALAKIGRRGGSLGYAYSGSPWPSHAVACAVVIGAVGTMGERLLAFNWRAHVDVRRRALRKREREAKKA